jgi:hypothetical protein
MKRKKILKALADLLDAEKRRKHRHRDELAELLKKLEHKEFELEKELGTEKDRQRQKRLRKELEIVRAQREKGIETLQELEAS